MEKLKIYVCENLYYEYEEAIKREEIDEVELIALPTLCDQKGRKKEAKELFSKADTKRSLLICSKSCDALKLIQKGSSVETVTCNYCFTHLTCDEFLDYLTSQGSYVVTTGWLKNWKEHIEIMGFEKDKVRDFFQKTSKQIVFLDSKIDATAQNTLKELSSYLGLPYITVAVELETIRMILKSKINEWRLHSFNVKCSKEINELRSQCADYSAVFDMFGKISSYTNKRDIIGRVKNLFMMVFGAKKFNFWSENSELIPDEIREFKLKEDIYILLKNENRFCIKVSWDSTLYGILDVSGFLFPQFIDRYLNLALSITRLLGLVLHNNEQYEIIVKSEQDLKYLSFHDSMTGLYNRTYINQLLTDKAGDDKTIVFMFDIDKLKYVNDNLGHSFGDKLIKSFAEVVKQSFRETDIVARIGGDEFTAVLYDADEKMAKTVQQRISDLIKINNENLIDKHLELSVSIGYAISKNENETIEDLMKKADVLMYENKRKKDFKNDL
ncbi:MAG: diguanylate cyclase [Synergistaceae bacterium]|nr:diguanylate cyclase [Synergistaceae bacterium]